MNPALENLEKRGFISQCTDMDGLSRLMDAGPVTFYVGCDPTGKSLHIGHMVPFFAFRHLRAAGHRGIALVGGGTARIGDPSGKSEMRKMLNYDELDANAEAIKAQLGRFLGDFDDRTAICTNNKDWLANLNYIDFLREIGSHFSVNRMLSFEAYKKRMESGLSFIEFNYQLLQSYDFLQLYRRYGCLLQIGGDDQWGNIVAGMELIRRMEGEGRSAGSAELCGKSGAEGGTAIGKACFGLTFPLVTTSNGNKMGKTEKGAIFLDPNLTSPYEFFQYWRNVSDADIKRFLLMFTFLPVTECEALCAEGKNPNEAKERLAWELCALIHGKGEADKALAGAKAAFGLSDAGQRDSIPSKKLSRVKLEAKYNIVDLFSDAALCPTKSEARRLIQQGGAAFLKDGELLTIKDIAAFIGVENLDEQGALLLRAGKKRFCRVVFE
ncbi:MAG: tyrosine--tRNA ligase [Spirochaetaceae bacterium]|nr:tyrosine--tRNA ligase [Spirochaetaceae bacterium]